MRLPNEKVFVENSSYPRGSVKKRIIQDCLIPYVCAECGLVPLWNGRKLVLHLEHANGVNNDHR